MHVVLVEWLFCPLICHAISICIVERGSSMSVARLEDSVVTSAVFSSDNIQILSNIGELDVRKYKWGILANNFNSLLCCRYVWLLSISEAYFTTDQPKVSSIVGHFQSEFAAKQVNIGIADGNLCCCSCEVIVRSNWRQGSLSGIGATSGC